MKRIILGLLILTLTSCQGDLFFSFTEATNFLTGNVFTNSNIIKTDIQEELEALDLSQSGALTSNAIGMLVDASSNKQKQKLLKAELNKELTTDQIDEYNEYKTDINAVVDHLKIKYYEQATLVEKFRVVEETPKLYDLVAFRVFHKIYTNVLDTPEISIPKVDAYLAKPIILKEFATSVGTLKACIDTLTLDSKSFITTAKLDMALKAFL